MLLLTVINMGELVNSRWESKLFQPLKIGNGKLELKHRVVHAPLTRNRGTPLSSSTPEKPNRIWVPNEHVVNYYTQRATAGGLIISEGLPPSLEVRPLGEAEHTLDTWTNVVGKWNARCPWAISEGTS